MILILLTPIHSWPSRLKSLNPVPGSFKNLEKIRSTLFCFALTYYPNFTTKRQSSESSEENTASTQTDQKRNRQRLLFQCQVGRHRPLHFKRFISRTVFILLLHGPAVTSCSSPCSSPITQPIPSNLLDQPILSAHTARKNTRKQWLAS